MLFKHTRTMRLYLQTTPPPKKEAMITSRYSDAKIYTWSRLKRKLLGHHLLHHCNKNASSRDIVLALTSINILHQCYSIFATLPPAFPTPERNKRMLEKFKKFQTIFSPSFPRIPHPPIPILPPHSQLVKPVNRQRIPTTLSQRNKNHQSPPNHQHLASKKLHKITIKSAQRSLISPTKTT